MRQEEEHQILQQTGSREGPIEQPQPQLSLICPVIGSGRGSEGQWEGEKKTPC